MGVFVYAMKKGMRLGVLDSKYKENADRGINGIGKTLKPDACGLSVTDVSAGTFPVPYLSKKYYSSRKLLTNKNYGIGTVLLALSEYL